MKIMKSKLKFECIIEFDDDYGLQVKHLPEEIQMYLDSNYEEDSFAKVTQWRTTSL